LTKISLEKQENEELLFLFHNNDKLVTFICNRLYI